MKITILKMRNIHYRIIVYTLLIVCLGACSSSSNYCDNPQVSFESVHSAERTILNNKFVFEESVRTPESSWIAKAIYKSCDESTGYFIYYKKGGDKYLHSNVPINVWYGFKNASSKGHYINANLKGRYGF